MERKPGCLLRRQKSKEQSYAVWLIRYRDFYGRDWFFFTWRVSRSETNSLLLEFCREDHPSRRRVVLHDGYCVRASGINNPGNAELQLILPVDLDGSNVVEE